jgi:hypothetical protein
MCLAMPLAEPEAPDAEIILIERSLPGRLPAVEGLARDRLPLDSFQSEHLPTRVRRVEERAEVKGERAPVACLEMAVSKM